MSTIRSMIARNIFNAWSSVWSVEFKYTMIIAHARSGSKLLCHLLMGHSEFAGYGDRKAVYRTDKDLDRWAMRVHFDQRIFRPRAYVVDQLTENWWTPNLDLLTRPDVRLIFLIREPRAAISSYLTLPESSLEIAIDHYIGRLAKIYEIAQYAATKRCSFFLTYQDLTEYPDETLMSLTEFLGLKTPLVPEYKTFGFSNRGQPASDQIMAEKIRPEKPRPLVDLPPSIAVLGQNLFERVSKICSDRCSVIERANTKRAI